MDSQGLWNGSLHSYRKNLSSTTALNQVTDTVVTASDNKKVKAAIAVDESAAFDNVNHCIIMDKLKLYRPTIKTPWTVSRTTWGQGQSMSL